MRRWRRVVLLVVATVGLVTATGGYTAVTGDRAVSINVVSDDDAYVGFIDKEPSNQDDETPVLQVTNRLPTSVDLKLTVDEPDPVKLTLNRSFASIDSGGSATLMGKVSCDAEAPPSVIVPVTLSVDDEDTGTRAELRREVTVRCERPPIEAQAKSDGTAEADGDDEETEETETEGDDEETEETETEGDDEETEEADEQTEP